MLSRRKLLLGVAPLALAGCSAGSLQSGISKFAQAAYTDINVVAAYLESLAAKVASGALTAANAAAQFVVQAKPYIVPACQLFVSLVKLTGQLAAADPAIGNNKQFVAVYGQANVLASNTVIQAAASSGVVPSDPVTVLTGVIQLTAQIMTLTNGKASPIAAAAA